MNILHLYSDWRWTGPADPVLNMCKKLQERGHNVILAYRKPPIEFHETIEGYVNERQIKAIYFLNLNRYFNINDNVRDVVRLKRFIVDQKIDVVNTHLSHDHIIGAISVRLSSKKSALIRTDHLRDSFTSTLGNKILLNKFTDGIITFSEKALKNITENIGVPLNRIAKINPAVDCDIFSPDRPFTDMRRHFGLDNEDVVVGIVTRFQKYRKMNIFFQALSAVVRKMPNVKALLLGASSKMRETVHEPIKIHSLEKNVIIGGYLKGEDYINAFATMDMFVFLIAGSDGTGRAMREAMAMGKPVIANNVGMLPEMVDEGVSGFVFSDNAEELAKLILKIASDKEMRLSMGKSARIKAKNDFSLDNQSAEIEAFYENILRQKHGL